MPTLYVYTKELDPDTWSKRNELLREYYKIPENMFPTQEWNCFPGCQSGCYKGGVGKCYMCYIYQDVSTILFLGNTNPLKRKRGE